MLFCVQVSIMSLYLPSGTNDARLDFKLNYMDEFQDYINKLKKEKPNLVICGDYNICHQEIDIHNPKMKGVSGFLPVEREWIGHFIDSGFIDSFRYLNKEPHHYSWWSYRANLAHQPLTEADFSWYLNLLYRYYEEGLIDSVHIWADNDGTKFSAKDVKATLDYYSDPQKPGFGWLPGKLETTIVDDYTVHVKTEKPVGSLIYSLGLVSIMSAADIASGKIKDRPNGTGPWKFVKQEGDTHLCILKHLKWSW